MGSAIASVVGAAREKESEMEAEKEKRGQQLEKRRRTGERETKRSDADYWLLPDADVSITDLWGIMYPLWTVILICIEYTKSRLQR
ncbi:hypothetical protein LOK49_LG05G03323 [Camellia lanceoleosa]|uniref:Uncharacterized protein n=1 Tax=Camellia lanceoleosa TaxID=1840588 RepID=A0ACC0HHF4_9ERIC|nr:hypothetical protein LOK49_LG05G03323 [Camellia lanceoleosa]